MGDAREVIDRRTRQGDARRLLNHLMARSVASEVAKARRVLDRLAARGRAREEWDEESEFRRLDEERTRRQHAMALLDGHTITAQTQRRNSK